MAVRNAPLCFDRPPTFAEIMSIKARGPIQIHFLREILDTAVDNGISDPWVTALRLAIAKNRVAQLGRVVGRRVSGKIRSLHAPATKAGTQPTRLGRNLTGTPTAANSR
jgi:hypothetical protein